MLIELPELYAVVVATGTAETILQVRTPLGPFPMIAPTLDDLRRFFDQADATCKLLGITWRVGKFKRAGDVPKVTLGIVRRDEDGDDDPSPEPAPAGAGSAL